MWWENRSHGWYVQLHVPLPWELSDPSLCGSKADVEEMLITLAVLRLVEPFARRSERLESDNHVMHYNMPDSYNLTRQSLKNCLQIKTNDKEGKKKRTV